MEPQEIVKQVVASARLEGVELDEPFQVELLLVAQGRLDGEVLVARLVKEVQGDGQTESASDLHG